MNGQFSPGGRVVLASSAGISRRSPTRARKIATAKSAPVRDTGRRSLREQKAKPATRITEVRMKIWPVP
jgi:hypothetical protein